jgi:hypothetical protein
MYTLAYGKIFEEGAQPSRGLHAKIWWTADDTD